MPAGPSTDVSSGLGANRRARAVGISAVGISVTGVGISVTGVGISVTEMNYAGGGEGRIRESNQTGTVGAAGRVN